MGSYKGRKCDRPKQQVDAVRRDCCPICTLPAHNRYLPATGENSLFQTCAFFAKNSDLDFGGNEQKRKMFEDYHAAVCKSCKLPIEVCKKRRIAALERKVRLQCKVGTRDMGKDYYIEDDEIAEWLKQPCTEKPNRKNYTPAFPSWWTDK